jgi:hypothetical protein
MKESKSYNLEIMGMMAIGAYLLIGALHGLFFLVAERIACVSSNGLVGILYCPDLDPAGVGHLFNVITWPFNYVS